MFFQALKKMFLFKNVDLDFCFYLTARFKFYNFYLIFFA